MKKKDQTILAACILAAVICLVVICGVIRWQFARFERDMQIEVPDERLVQATSDPAYLVEVLSSGELLLNGKPLAIDEVRSLLVKGAKKQPDVAVSLTAQGEVDFKKVMSALDLIKEAGIWNVAFASSERSELND